MNVGVEGLKGRRAGSRKRLSELSILSFGHGSSRRDHTTIIIILVIAFVLRMGWAIYATNEPISLEIGGDAYAYYHQGERISSGHGYRTLPGGCVAPGCRDATGDATAYYPVGYPALLAGLFWIVRHTPIPDDLPMAASILNVTLGTASVALLFAIGRRLFGTTVGIIAALLLAIFPNAVYYVATTQLETTFIFLNLVLMSMVVFHDWANGIPSRRHLLAFGAVLGMTSLVRPFSLPFLAALGATSIVARVGLRKTAATVAWPMVTLLIVLAPWTIRNYSALGSPVPFSTNTGDTLCMGRGPEATGGFRWATGVPCAPAHYGEARRNSVSTRLALQYTLSHPADELALIPKRFKHMMAEDHDGLLAVESGPHRPFLGTRLRSLLVMVADAFFFATGVLALFGVPAFFWGRRPDRVFVGLGIVTLLLVPLSLWGNVRFHIPLLPFSALAAAVCITWVRQRLWTARTGAPLVTTPPGPP